MVLILGRNDDGSTTEVLEWLYFYNKVVLVLNTEDPITIVKYSPSQKKFIIMKDGVYYNLYDVTSVWNRRHGLSHLVLTRQYIDKDSQFFIEESDKTHYNYVREESKCLVDFIHYLVEQKSVVKLGSFFYNDVNKLIVLSEANALGLMTPPTIIVSTKVELLDFRNEFIDYNIITKPLSQGIYRSDINNRFLYYSYVERITEERMNNLPNHFYPSLFQVEEKKSYELRIFFLMGEFYTMAIFSQLKADAVVDFRKTNHREKALVCVPFKLPKKIEKKLTLLMNKLKLNTGSIDMIVNDKSEYVFLEINPCGQFGMTSYPCNYYLERKIAQILI